MSLPFKSVRSREIEPVDPSATLTPSLEPSTENKLISIEPAESAFKHRAIATIASRTSCTHMRVSKRQPTKLNARIKRSKQPRFFIRPVMRLLTTSQTKAVELITITTTEDLAPEAEIT